MLAIALLPVCLASETASEGETTWAARLSDEVVQLPDDAARTGLMAKPFEFSEIQANFILDMQLRRLTQLEGKKLRGRVKALRRKSTDGE